MSRDRRKAMVSQVACGLSLVRQCELVGISRSSFYYEPTGETVYNLKLMKLIDGEFLRHPCLGSRQMKRFLRRQGYRVNRKRVHRLMQKMGLTPIYQAPRTSQPHPEHRIYPYLLRHLEVTEPNHVWCADITYIPMHRGFLYLVAIMDWSTRAVLAWRLSNTMHSDFCVEALKEALDRYGKPEIFNTDQGSQFTSNDFTDELDKAGVRISMDGRGSWRDNVFIERLWRSLKYECVYLREMNDGHEALRDIGDWLHYYNHERPHSQLGGDRTPMEAYTQKQAA
jgi:putative transposase